MPPQAETRTDIVVSAPGDLPAGNVTFLFTDIEGSTRLWERDRPIMTRAARRHDALLAEAVVANHGVLFKHVGDMVQAAFPTPLDGVLAAIAAQQALHAEPWPETGPIRVRMGVHCGEAAPNAKGDYNQVACLNRLARLMAAAHGGQVVISQVIRDAVSAALPPEVTLRDMGLHRLRDLLEPEHVSQLVISGLPDQFPPLKTLEGHPSNLPTLPTALIGRDRELQELTSLLAGEGSRLVTLVGPGGVGKTHLALQAAADLVEHFSDGVWLVRLGDVRDPAMVLPTVAATLGVREGGGLDMRQALQAWIGKKRVLFVLDNFEQVITGASAVAELLAESQNARVLTTSRQRLGIRGEHVFAVQPLPVTAEEGEDRDLADSAAVRLFLQRASEVAPGFSLDEKNAATVAAICASLDGLPLAIELAAARLRTHTLPELLSDLEHRFDLLVNTQRDGHTHQQSLETTIAWSYDRLDPTIQRALRVCSVFAGGWSRDAAEQLSDDKSHVSRSLDALVEQSLVRRDTTTENLSRWSMLESIRAFGRTRLEETGEAREAHDRHANWCLALAQEADEKLNGGEQERWLDRLDLEHDNAREALRWLSEANESEHALTLASALGVYWQTRGHLTEGRRWLESALTAADSSSSAQLRAMLEAGALAHAQSDFDGARSWYQRALIAARERQDRGREAALLTNLGGIALEQGDAVEAERFFNEGLALAESMNDKRRRADALGNLGAVAHYRADTELALRRYLECLQVWRELNDGRGIADMLLNVLFLLAPVHRELARARAAGEEALRRFQALDDPIDEALALTGLGLVAKGEGDLDRAVELHEQSLDRATQIEDHGTESRAISNLSAVELDRGNFDRADTLIQRYIQLSSDHGDLDGVASALELRAAFFVATGQFERAARLQGAAGTLRDQINVPSFPELSERNAATTDTLSRQLGNRYLELMAAGATLDWEQAVVEGVSRPAPSEDPFASSLHLLDDLLGVST